MATTIKLTVNGTPRELHTDDPNMPLLYALRDELGLHGLHFGCGLAQCGACTVHYYGEALRCCVMPISAVAGAEVVTLEGLGHRRETASIAAGLHRRAGGAVRLLHQRHDHAGGGVSGDDQTARPKSRSDRRWRATCASAARTCGFFAR